MWFRGPPPAVRAITTRSISVPFSVSARRVSVVGWPSPRLYPTEEGTPQGGVISPVLANLVLDGLETVALQADPLRRGNLRPKINVVRYADDFIITGSSREQLEERVTVPGRAVAEAGVLGEGTRGPGEFTGPQKQGVGLRIRR